MTRILAGPILRRVERSQINIWIASSEPMKFIGRLYDRMHALKLNRYGITSTAADNHLLTFAEYAGIYLAVLGGATDLPKKPFNRIHGNSRDHYNRDKERAEAFFAGRQSVRRLLANIPVYMIFDDHEVTDDWNLNPAWEARIYGNPFARR